MSIAIFALLSTQMLSCWGMTPEQEAANFRAKEAELLYVAAKNGNVREVDNLLDKKVDRNIPHNNVTPLLIALISGHEKIVEKLWDDKSVEHKIGHTMAGSGKKAFNNIFHCVIPMPKDFVKKLDSERQILTFVLAHCSQDQKIALLNEGDENGWTPLHIAALYGLEDFVSKFLAAGANPQSIDNKGRTPLALVHDVEGVLNKTKTNTDLSTLLTKVKLNTIPATYNEIKARLSITGKPADLVSALTLLRSKLLSLVDALKIK